MVDDISSDILHENISFRRSSCIDPNSFDRRHVPTYIPPPPPPPRRYELSHYRPSIIYVSKSCNGYCFTIYGECDINEGNLVINIFIIYGLISLRIVIMKLLHSLMKMLVIMNNGF